jgi:glycosyltransferase involved in cell wall biosynthesis
VLGGGGVTINPEDTEEYAAALSRLLSNPAECQRLGALGLERSRKVFDWSVIAESWRELLMSVAENNWASAAPLGRSASGD